MTTHVKVSFAFWLAFQLLPIHSSAQGVQPYPNAITDRRVRTATPMTPPPVRAVFKDPDFGSLMVRVTDGNTNPKRLGSYFRNSSADATEWSADSGKFFVEGENAGLFAFGFVPASMTVYSLPGAGTGGGLRLPFLPTTTFSSVDPDLIYGTTRAAHFTISSYRFSTNKTAPVYDLTICGTQPPIVSSPTARTNDLTTSADDNRFVVSAGGTQFGNRILVVVYDRKLGCRWFNTQTGQIGGQWGASGNASTSGFLVRHSSISGDGNYIKIGVDKVGFYIWDLSTLNVTACLNSGPLKCGGYGSLGFNTYINPAGAIDQLNLLKRPLGNLAGMTPLLNPLPLPYYWGMELHPTWGNGRFNNNSPLCGNAYSPVGDTTITQPYDGEVFCMETDGLASTVWRFAHNRTIWDPEYYWTDPFGNTSNDGRFFMFSSTWDGQVGVTSTGPRSDVWIVKLN